jgi:UDP-glucose 4-epimerase
MSKKKLLITGATGLIGTALVNKLIKEGIEVTALCRNKKLGFNSDVNWIEIDFKDQTIDLGGLLANVDILIHNAAVKSEQTPDEIKEMRSFNFDFTERLLVASAKQGLKKIIFSSGLNIIAKPLPDLITEDAAVNPITIYAQSKWFAEQKIESLAKEHDFSFNILRISSPVSFDLDMMPVTVVKKWIGQSLAGQNIQVFGKGTRTQDFVAVPDIADAFVNCIQQDEVSGIFNIASGTAISMLDLAKMISGKFSNQYQFCGEDVNEKDRWNISIKKAQQQLNYVPKYNSTQTITALLNNIL